ncbi:MAG: M48 family metallopeptidase [Verrucomicrobia bacterium]|nr:M48 family metallopeptidase [Verrucomicrobiota bacterium]
MCDHMLDMGRSTATTPAGELTLPYARLTIHHQDSETGQVYFCHPDFAGTWLVTGTSEILMEPAIQERTALKRQIRDYKMILPDGGASSRPGSLGLTLKWCAVLAGFVVIVTLGIMALLGAAIAFITPSMEAVLGETAVKDYLSDYPVVSPGRADWVREIQKKISSSIPDNPYQYQIYFIEEDTPNAMAFPGGHIVVTTGLIELIGEDEDLMAGVMAHETAHVIHRHGLRQIVNQAGPAMAVQLFIGDSSGLIGAITRGSILFSNLSYSRAMELEADASAIQYLRTAEFDPTGLKAFLIRIQALFQDSGPVPTFLSTHPATETRIEKLNER